MVNKSSLLPNNSNSNLFFYKTRNSSSYLTYLFNLSSYVNILALSADVNYKRIIDNNLSFYSYFQNLSKFNLKDLNSRSIVNKLTSSEIESIYSSNSSIDYTVLDSHFYSFFEAFLKNNFSKNNFLMTKRDTGLSTSFISNYKSVYSFLNAQTFTVHNTRLEII